MKQKNSMQEEENNYIYTDPYKTKELIWRAYEGLLEQYEIYKSYLELYGNAPIEQIFGMNRYITTFYLLTNIPFKQFGFTKEELIKLKTIVDKQNREKKEYDYLAYLFTDFMFRTGIMNIVREKEDLNNTILNNR